MSESELFEKIEYLEQRIAELTPRWVRVEDGLPYEGDVVTAQVFINGMKCKMSLYRRDDCWMSIRGKHLEAYADVIAWLRMPDEPEYIHEPIR